MSSSQNKGSMRVIYSGDIWMVHAQQYTHLHVHEWEYTRLSARTKQQQDNVDTQKHTGPEDILLLSDYQSDIIRLPQTKPRVCIWVCVTAVCGLDRASPCPDTELNVSLAIIAGCSRSSLQSFTMIDQLIMINIIHIISRNAPVLFYSSLLPYPSPSFLCLPCLVSMFSSAPY